MRMCYVISMVGRFIQLVLDKSDISGSGKSPGGNACKFPDSADEMGLIAKGMFRLDVVYVQLLKEFFHPHDLYVCFRADAQIRRDDPAELSGTESERIGDVIDSNVTAGLINIIVEISQPDIRSSGVPEFFERSVQGGSGRCQRPGRV